MRDLVLHTRGLLQEVMLEGDLTEKAKASESVKEWEKAKE
jgi:hypothetical protein